MSVVLDVAAHSSRWTWTSVKRLFISQREVDLDVVRGIAILLAMGWHLNHIKTGTPIDWVLFPGARFGWAGVDIFFVLSGFLVGRMLLKERSRYGRVNLKVFYIRRILRLWPVLYVFLFAMLLLTDISYKTYFYQIAFHIQNYWRTPVATHLWSLAVEEHFYVVASVGLLIAGNVNASNRCILGALIAVPAVTIVLRACACLAGWDAASLQMQSQFRMDALSSGVLVAFVSITYPGRFAQLLGYRSVWVAVTVLGFSSLAFMDKASWLGETLGYSISWLSSCSLLLAVYKSGIENHAKLLCSVLAFFGLIAYPLYLWHVPAERLISAIFTRNHLAHPVLLLLSEYAGAALIATVMRASIELPIMMWRDRITPGKSDPVS